VTRLQTALATRREHRRATSVVQPVAFLNLGRGNTEARRKALADLRAACDPRAVVGLAEITPDEMVWVKQLWKGWTIEGRGQTYAVVSPLLTIHTSVIRRIFRAIPRYGSTRHAVRVTVSDTAPKRRVVVAHAPAEFGNSTFMDYFRRGQRVGWRVVRRWLTGRRAVLLADMNVHGTDPLPPLPDIEVLVRDGVDVIVAGAPTGWAVEMRGHRVVPSSVEPQHDGHVGNAVWRRVRPLRRKVGQPFPLAA
jgi:hypothetical protein